MPEYLSTTDVQNRLTAAGVQFVADRDGDGVVSPAEVEAYLVSAIEYAGNLVDAALTQFVEPALARAAGNGWLRDRALDIAACRAAGQGGDSVPARMQADFDFALQELERIRNGARVPGLVYPTPPRGNGRTTRVPRAINLD